MLPVELPIFHIDLPKPRIGNKISYFSQTGMYVLEKGPVTWRAMANTHQGTGNITVYDGVPNDKGHFPNEPAVVELIKNGRIVFNANPPILGMWMFDGGLYHGLTIVIEGGLANITPSITVTWAPDSAQKRNITNV